MKKLPLYLLIAIPAASILMGIVSLYLAFSSPDLEIRQENAPLSKTSWQEMDDGDDR